MDYGPSYKLIYLAKSDIGGSEKGDDAYPQSKEWIWYLVGCRNDQIQSALFIDVVV